MVGAVTFILKHHAFAQAVILSINAQIQIEGEVRPRTRLAEAEHIILAFHTSLSIFPPKSLHTCFYIQRYKTNTHSGGSRIGVKGRRGAGEERQNRVVS